MPKLLRPHHPIILLLALILASPAQAGFEPRAVMLEGLPPDAGSYSGVLPSGSGWVVATSKGYIRQQNGGWVFRQPPVSGKVTVAIPFAKGVLVAGDDFCWIDGEDGWHDTGWRDTFIQGTRYGEDVFVMGLKAAYRLDPTGVMSRSIEFPTPIVFGGVHPVEGRLGMSTFSPYHAYEWIRGEFQEVTEREGWDAALGMQAWWFQRPDDQNGYIFTGTRQFPSWVRLDPDTLAVLHRLWPEIRTLPLAGLGSTNLHIQDHLLVPAAAGLIGYSLRTGDRLWQVGQEQLRGSPTAIRILPEGVLVSSTGGLGIVLEPELYRHAVIPKAEIFDTTPSSQGLLISTPAGTFGADGHLVADYPPVSIKHLELASGAKVWTELFQLNWSGKRLPIANLAWNCQGLEELGPDLIGVLMQRKLLLLRPDGRATTVELPSAGLSLVGLPAVGEALVGTNDGVRVYRLDGSLARQFGHGSSTVFRFRDTAMAVDGTGVWFDAAGREIGRLPYTTLASAHEWRGGLFVYGKMADGKSWPGLVDLQTKVWRPLDLPQLGSPLAFGVEQDRLLVVMNGEVLRVEQPKYLEPPVAAASLMLRNHPWQPNGTLAPAEDELELRLPPPRLEPWANPEWSLQVGSGEWQTLAPGARSKLSRLPWGLTEIRVRAAWAGLQSTVTYRLDHTWPWWARWPGWLLYGGVLGLSGFGLVRWRDRRLERQTRQLELTVSERTEQLTRAKSEAEAANAVKSEFIASMNHEIRNPMNGILGLARILSEEELPPRHRTLLSSLEACTEQLRSTMDDVLDFRSLEKGEVTLTEEVFELGDLLRGACAAADLEGNRIRLLDPPGAPVVLRGDQGKFRQIMGNYLSNALKYGLPPRAEVEVELGAPEPDRTLVNVRVRNQGPTLSAEEQARLFTLFFRGSRAQASGASGTGLGLAVCRRLATAMGGQTGVTSENGLTTFAVLLPFARAAAGAEASLSLGSERLGGRILAVEDERYNRLVLGHYFKRLGFEVDWAERGESALALARGAGHRLIVTDWFLPDMHGGTLMARLREILGGEMPPVLVISAYATAEKKAEALAAGAQAFLTKPVDEFKLRTTLAALRLGPVLETSARHAPSGEEGFDFSPLLGLSTEAEVLDQFVAEVERSWTAATGLWFTGRPEAIRRVHQLRSQVLLVQAREAEEQLRLLEQALEKDGDPDDLAALIDCAGQEIRALLEEARRQP